MKTVTFDPAVYVVVPILASKEICKIASDYVSDCRYFSDVWDSMLAQIPDNLPGVTVQEWISVNDRLPIVDEVVLVTSDFLGDPVVLQYQNFPFPRFFNHRTSRFCSVSESLHWMPLPAPAIQEPSAIEHSGGSIKCEVIKEAIK